MWTILKRELKNYLRNPLLWIWMIIIVLFLYQALYPYLQLHYLQSETELSDKTVKNVFDADIMDGYVTLTKKQQWEDGYQEIKRKFIEESGYPEDEAQKVIEELKQKNLSISELNEYLVDNYEFYNADWIVREAAFHKGSLEEVNGYIEEKMNEHPYSYYFSRKFADFGGLFMGFFSMIMLVFMYIRDTKKDTYELLHTKPISARAYIGGKVMGGFTAMLFVLGVLNLIFGIVCEVVGRRNGFPVRFWDIIAASILYIVPNLLMITCFHTIVALIFKNPSPSIPLLFLYIVYSNMGSVGPDGAYGYYGRPLAIMVRFPGRFLDTTPPPLVFLNQLFLIVTSVLIIFVAVKIWKRRRVY